MREEIIPQMMHNSQLLEKDLNIEEIDIEELEDKNPEWEKNMKKSVKTSVNWVNSKWKVPTPTWEPSPS